MKLGQYIPSSNSDHEPVIVCDDARLQPHIHRPWFRAYVERQLGIPFGSDAASGRGSANVSDSQLARHTLLCGATGSGKTRLLEHLLREQIQQGCSAIVIDPKGETADRMLADAVSRGVSPSTVTLIDPRSPLGIPGFNPLLTGVPLAQAVCDFVAVVERSATSWGPRLQDLLTNALLVVGAHGLSVYELARLLVRDDYREALLGKPIMPGNSLAYAEAVSYFRDEFGAWPRSERTQAVSPVLNKLRELLRSEYLCPLLCAQRNTLNLAALWQRPGLVIIRLDRAALGEEGARLLGGWLVHLLFRTALRTAGKVPVVLAIDELPILEKFVGEALAEIVTVARSQNLRLLVACQHLDQLSNELRSALLANAAVHGFFRVGFTDARLIATSLAAGAEPTLARLIVSVDRQDRRTGLPKRIESRHLIRDPHGRPLRLPVNAWQRFRWDDLCTIDALGKLEGLAAARGIPRLYVHAAGSSEPVAVRSYIRGLSGSDYWIDGPDLALVVSFPQPKLTGVDRRSGTDAVQTWTRTLQELPTQHAVLRQAGGRTGVIRVVDVPTVAVSRHQCRSFLAVCQAANGQSAAEVTSVLTWRQEEVERLATGRTSPHGRKEVDDGSLD